MNLIIRIIFICKTRQNQKTVEINCTSNNWARYSFFCAYQTSTSTCQQANTTQSTQTTSSVQHLHRHHRRPHPAINRWHGKLVKRKPYASQYYQDAAYGYQHKQQQSTQQLTATLNDIDLKRVEKYEYLGVVLNNSMNYDAQWDVTSSKTNPHIYLTHFTFTRNSDAWVSRKTSSCASTKAWPWAITSTAHPC